MHHFSFKINRAAAKRALLACLALFCTLSACQSSPAEETHGGKRGRAQMPRSARLPEPIDFRMRAAEALLSSLSPEQKVGQLFFARFPAADEISVLHSYQPGGYILFAGDFAHRTPDSLRDTLAACQEAAAVPMLIGVDEEGGSVVRASRYSQFRSTRFLSPQALYAQGGMEAIRADAAEKASFLLALGINVNLAPVCDVTVEPRSFMYPRAFGQDAAQTTQYVQTVVSEFSAAGLGAVLKHFPGYGEAADTHIGTAYDTRDLNLLITHDFLPFEAGINAGAGSVLVSHNIITATDETHPASLSPAVHALLREHLAFEGVIITDDLIMDAVRQFAGSSEAAVQAVLAGNDMLITSDLAVQYQAVLDAVHYGAITEAQLDAAVMRVLLWKYDLGLLD